MAVLCCFSAVQIFSLNDACGSGAVSQRFEKLTLETKTLIFFPAGCE
jgi:hypothetical protein